VSERSYPSRPGEAGLLLFAGWVGARYARSVSDPELITVDDGLHAADLTLGRRWRLRVVLLDLAAAEAVPQLELQRAAVEQRLDARGEPIVLWVPRGAALPAEEPNLSELVAALDERQPVGDGREEARIPVRLYLRRTATSGSVVTVAGGLQDHWAQFTNRVPGTFQLNALELHRLSARPEWRAELVERIVHAAQQPEVDEGVAIDAFDCWTVTPLPRAQRSYVVSAPGPWDEETSAAQRRALRQLLRRARESERGDADARALLVFGVSTYGEEERLSWALRGVDPSLYASYDLVAVVTDGLVKLLLEPPRGTFPWDAPLG